MVRGNISLAPSGDDDDDDVCGGVEPSKSGILEAAVDGGTGTLSSLTLSGTGNRSTPHRIPTILTSLLKVNTSCQTRQAHNLRLLIIAHLSLPLFVGARVGDIEETKLDDRGRIEGPAIYSGIPNP